MPSPDYNFEANIVIACEGPEEGEVRTGSFGVRRSRDGAKLDYVMADAHFWNEQFHNDDSQDGNAQKQHVLLKNPTRDEVVAAIADAGKFLRHYKGEPGWNGGQINLAFAGHGTEKGALVLANAELSPDELAEITVECTWTREQQSLRFATVFDSCFSGRTLAGLLVHPFHGKHFLLIDGFAASLHDEPSWELDSLGHGALTFTMRNIGNAHVDQNRLARAVQEQDEEYMRIAFQGFAPNPVTYLTDGDQHSIDLMNGHGLTIKGCGTLEIRGEPTLDQVLEKMEQLRAHPDIHNIVEL